MPKFPNMLVEGAGVAAFANELPKEKAGVEMVSHCVLVAGALRPLDCAPNVCPDVLAPKGVESSAVTAFELNGVEDACELAFDCIADPKPPNRGLVVDALSCAGVAG